MSQHSLKVPSRENEESRSGGLDAVLREWEDSVDSRSLHHTSAASWFQVIKPQEPRWPPAGLGRLPPTNTTAPFAKCSCAAEPQSQGEDVTERECWWRTVPTGHLSSIGLLPSPVSKHRCKTHREPRLLSWSPRCARNQQSRKRRLKGCAPCPRSPEAGRLRIKPAGVKFKGKKPLNCLLVRQINGL